jgi:F0F1-type ATP synthase membrane subunit c/vacuolar-type H+-ATPase subunit K
MGLVLIGSFFSGGAAAATPGTENVHSTVNCNGNATCDLDSTLSNIQYFLIGVGVLLAGIAFAIYGIQYVAGSLEEMPAEKRFQRKKQFMEIMVGLVIVLMSAVLVTIAQSLIVTT